MVVLMKDNRLMDVSTLWLTSLLIFLHPLQMPLGWIRPLNCYCWQLQMSCKMSNLNRGLCLPRPWPQSRVEGGKESSKMDVKTSDLLPCPRRRVAPWESFHHLSQLRQVFPSGRFWCQQAEEWLRGNNRSPEIPLWKGKCLNRKQVFIMLWPLPVLVRSSWELVK